MRKREPSRGEVEAWKQLRLLRQEGFAFRREHKLGRYNADFVCLPRRVIVEVDGGVHDFRGAAEHDAKRDAWLSSEGFVVLRFRDRDILSERNWLNEVRRKLAARPEAAFHKRPSTLPLEGREQGGGVMAPRDKDAQRITSPPIPSPSRRGG